ncbi:MULTISPECIES: helix-turn-helix domain-containing protein [Methylibium]|uniref:Transcriptional activator of acetoin/glycerol metabolism-like protein n=1 Tax=Methylibium petroleiphilum (strain ATCC BAA-1232 / LMG 22953 / PM1) TaxID=420662 RepID=A2SCL3_METPP|nr:MULTISPECIES: helix-turn-helix domain-containing protein [Methylibium]ABM93302.1 transcriptional activator of acetoin/glycerol metabolism-like protein [Methylibium petroleiphilum PM1]EWS56509.1 Acetoin catabolism regulatory protein [Methylibium sp. T29]EWS61298.1 Acetoin catabolism regulatory protein [Methylibium sp. T29-B]
MTARVPAVRQRPSPESRLPAGPFFATAEQRVALARERFFEEGVRPSGLVPELVIQSWTRCVGARRRPNEHVTFSPITKSRVAGALARNRQLLDAAKDDLSQLDAALAGTACKALLTSNDGVIVHATPTALGEGRLMPIMARVGNDLAESNVGTGAPGVSARTGEVCVVSGAEHFFSGFNVMYCAAAPIRNTHGEIAGVLDLSSEEEQFRFDAAAMVRLYATTIENRLLRAQSREHLLLRFQSSPGLLHTPLEGLAAIDGNGRVCWVNGAGTRLLAGAHAGSPTVEQTFGIDLESLLSLAHGARVQSHRVPGGLGMWLEAQPPEKDGHHGATALAFASPVATPAFSEPDSATATATAPVGGDARSEGEALTLVDSHRRMIDSTLLECGGNVSRAARQLGVSRGLIYRRLRERRSKDA